MTLYLFPPFPLYMLGFVPLLTLAIILICKGFGFSFPNLVNSLKNWTNSIIILGLLTFLLLMRYLYIQS